MFSTANACRNNLILKKLDPMASWIQHRQNNDIIVERRGGRIVKTLRGRLAGLQEHEVDAYVEIWKRQQSISRIATFSRLESRESDLTGKTIVLKDYGPDLLDWLHLIAPPRLEPQFHDAGQPSRSQPLGPLLDPRVLLALARALLEALAPFHRAGFVHCDIKHDNFCLQHRLAPGCPPSLSHPVSGELDFDTLTAIDLGCCLLPVTQSHRRVIHYTDETRMPLYIGAPQARSYIWPTLLGADTEASARQAAAHVMAEGWRGRHGAIPKPVANRYVSDHYLLCCEMAVLGQAEALNRLDWRVDFFSLGHLFDSILHHITNERRLEDAPSEMVDYLESLGGRLKSYDTFPFDPPPAYPHEKIIGEINDLIGVSACRRVPFEAMPNANPVPWFEGLPETSLTPSPSSLTPGSETPLRGGGGMPGQPYAEFRDLDQAPLLIALPAGQAWLGSPLDEAGRGADEPEPRLVRIDAFALGKYPVCFEEWDSFLESSGRPVFPEQDQGWGRLCYPVINVTLDDIRCYLAWLNRIAGWTEKDLHRYRLPTAEEWEYAARAGSRDPYPSGKLLRPEDAQYHIRPAPAEFPPRDRPAPVGSFPANPWHFHDLIGNVWEYVDAGSQGHMLRGGSWLNGPAFERAAAQQTPPASGRGNHIGFRVARSLGKTG